MQRDRLVLLIALLISISLNALTIWYIFVGEYPNSIIVSGVVIVPSGNQPSYLIISSGSFNETISLIACRDSSQSYGSFETSLPNGGSYLVRIIFSHTPYSCSSAIDLASATGPLPKVADDRADVVLTC